MEPNDLSWTDELCCDEAVPMSETPIQGGRVRPGDRVVSLGGHAPAAEASEASLAEGETGTILAIAAGFKGKSPFRKRLWVMLWVQPTLGGYPVRIAADRLAPSPA